MENPTPKLQEFVRWVREHVRGDEKGEAQTFAERLFQAFGHAGHKEAGATMEHRIKGGSRRGRTGFADLFWPPRMLLEMKKRGERLDLHYQQAFDYWLRLTPNKPKYVILCNFDEFRIYQFDQQLDYPVDTVTLDELPTRYPALNFLFPDERRPVFGNDRVAVTRQAADRVAAAFRLMLKFKEPRPKAQRFVLQCVVAMFAEDFDLLPRGLFTQLIDDCLKGGSSHLLIGGLFAQMNRREPAGGGPFKDVTYFNGGLFSTIEPVEMRVAELEALRAAAEEDWSKVEPAIFGSIFEQSMDAAERHAFGAHFTSAADIQKVVQPTIARPWREAIEAARTARELLDLRGRLLRYRVLDPACGSGNFLYIAYRELKRIESELMAKLARLASKEAARLGEGHVSAAQFFGIDINEFAVELAKINLSVAKALALREVRETTGDGGMMFAEERPLPLDNLDANIRRDDALFCEWPAADAIIGNPPFQAKNKMQKELGADYVRRVRQRYPEVPGRADYCVYWFRRAHDELRAGCRAGLVGTNTVRQNYSREGGLDHIVAKGGTITEAVGSQVWTGEAAVHVSIVNWIKGDAPGPKTIFIQTGNDADGPYEEHTVETINSSLSPLLDVAGAGRLRANMDSGCCAQGQTHGHEGFLLSPDEAAVIRRASTSKDVVHPYLIADELIGSPGGLPGRWCIDLNDCDDLLSAKSHAHAFAHVERAVLPDIKAKAEEERADTGRETGPRQNHFQRWWKFWRGRQDMLDAIANLPRYIACGRVTKRPIFDFVSSAIHPNDAVQVFPLPDDYSFGILQSGMHWEWFKSRCSTLKGDFRYTSDTVFDTFAWPQSPQPADVRAVADAAVALRALRRKVMKQNGWSLRELYRTLETPGKNPLRDAHQALDDAVRGAYLLGRKEDVLEFLLALNRKVSQAEAAGRPVQGPGLPACITDRSAFITDDCIRMPE